MRLAVELLERAEKDLDQIWTFTAERWGVDQAATYLGGLDDAIVRLAEFPKLARLRPEFSPPVRIHPYRAHLIVYLFDETTLTIVRLLLSRSNWAEVLDG